MRKLAELLRIELPHAVGLMEMLWHYVGQEMPQGNVGLASDHEIAHACGWHRKPSLLIEALVEASWLDRNEEHRLLVHDWEEHCEDAVRKWLKRSGRPFITAAGGADAGGPEPVIYFLRGEKSNKIKIGFTEGRIESRVAALQIGSPDRLVLLGVMPGSRWEETKLHRQFAAAAINGEWFEPIPDLLSFISANVRQEFGGSSAAEVTQFGSTHAQARFGEGEGCGEGSAVSSGENNEKPKERLPPRFPSKTTQVTDPQWFEFMARWAESGGALATVSDWDETLSVWKTRDLEDRMDAFLGLNRDHIGKENCLPQNYLGKRIYRRGLRKTPSNSRSDELRRVLEAREAQRS